MERLRTIFNSDEVSMEIPGGKSPRKVTMVIAASIIVGALFYTTVTIIAVVVFEQKLYEVQKEQARINQRYLKLNNSNAQLLEKILNKQNITSQKNYSTVVALRGSKTSKKKVEVQGCDSILTINNKAYRTANSSIGAYTDQPCTTTNGYISMGCRYVCQSSGKWAVTDNKGSIKVFYTVTTWYNANFTCSSDNATLLIIPDEAYFDDVKQKVRPLIADIQFVTSCGNAKTEFWIGANDLGSEGIFKWVNGDHYSVWHNQKQVKDNRGCDGNPADCVLIYTDTGVWEDRKCDATLPFICQKY